MESIKVTFEIPEAVLQKFMEQITGAAVEYTQTKLAEGERGDILSNKEVMAYLKIKRSTLYKWKQIGMPHKTIGMKTTYLRGEVADWRKNYMG